MKKLFGVLTVKGLIGVSVLGGALCTMVCGVHKYCKRCDEQIRQLKETSENLPQIDKFIGFHN